ncbi:hypothetical protein IQ215_03450 [Cyanobacterium stanieri LEGE 03274]|uniref:Plastid lipid-associated protein/fibrillin conserved domain-containing protein n=1 Tax=Cyanobacterium stanieri LEGE 03274 TaxID=1828756 RepID=A0ABR9V1G9_9CHRO|nr:hypothetical protein [Cyanobacterium stanieri]MBE9221744.1 hypothetical protein [Cyanobacterium stanieri LEGE 03274]
MDYLQTLHSAIEEKSKKPNSETIYSALLNAEKENRKHNIKYDFHQLLGNWRLIFITGTKSSQQKMGGLLGKGFYIPPFAKITISYTKDVNSSTILQGKVNNKVNVGLVNFLVSGPIKYIEKRNILAFDFNHLSMSLLGNQLYEQDIRSGVKSEEEFYQNNINKQAFFSYFLVTEKFIAARGRGGGLALWKKIK